MRLGIDDYGIRHQGWDHETRVAKAIELGAANLMLSLNGLSADDTERLAALRNSESLSRTMGCFETKTPTGAAGMASEGPPASGHHEAGCVRPF